MTQDILDVLRALVDAAFKAGGITDLAHGELHGKLDAAAEPEPEPEPVMPALPPYPPLPEPAGTEGTGFVA